MQNFPATSREMALSLWRNESLVRSLIYREVVGRYKGSLLGVFWSLITPIFMLLVYTFVFSVVFKANWGSSANGSKTEFALILFAGLLVFNLFAECLNRAPSLVLANINYVKKVVFPLEVLPWVSLGSALFHFTVSFVVWITAYVFLIGFPHWTVVLSPIIMAPFVLFVMGLSWALASLGVYLRDIGQFIGILMQLLMFLSPIFYPPSALPEKLQALIFLNPLALPIEMMRDAMYWGNAPNWTSWVLSCFASLAIAILGFKCFQRARRGFADVI
jgi:lipopolysaccharide transport system permease protein